MITPGTEKYTAKFSFSLSFYINGHPPSFTAFQSLSTPSIVVSCGTESLSFEASRSPIELGYIAGGLFTWTHLDTSIHFASFLLGASRSVYIRRGVYTDVPWNGKGKNPSICNQHLLILLYFVEN